MTITPGFNQYACDRCGIETYAVDGTPQAQSWKTIKRYDALGSENTRTFCPECNKLYRVLVAAQDAEFNDFMTPDQAAV